MKRDELVKLLLEADENLDVCVAVTDFESQLVGDVQLINDPNYGDMILIMGYEETR